MLHACRESRQELAPRNARRRIASGPTRRARALKYQYAGLKTRRGLCTAKCRSLLLSSADSADSELPRPRDDAPNDTYGLLKTHHDSKNLLQRDGR